MKRFRTLALAFAVFATTFAITSQVDASDHEQANAQVARIYALQAAFHRAATLQAPGTEDIAQRIHDMLALWSDDGSLQIGGATYHGKGSCAAGSMTLCDFFTNVAPPFLNPWISFSPAFKTSIEVRGNTGTLSFQCHYFDTAGVPKARILVDATVEKVGSRWLLDKATMTPGASAAVYP